ncbi:MAG: shikimate dehydrogenase [Hyphomicrobiaceae bacterium]
MNATTVRACVIGWPISHSRSPMIHGYWLKKYGIAGSYTRQPVRPGDVATFLKTLAEQGLVGCNVTAPHKEAAYAVADETTPAARAVKAANTLWLDRGRLHASNTDGLGFMNHLRASAPQFEPRNNAVAVLGAGGSARGIVHAMLEAGVGAVRVFNRTRERADVLARHFGARVSPHDWRDRVDRTRDVGLVINTTVLGMEGASELVLPVGQLAGSCVVADIVYVPLETPLLVAARARGLQGVDGLGMLLHQATPGFEKWFGVAPEVTPELCALVAADIGRT